MGFGQAAAAFLHSLTCRVRRRTDGGGRSRCTAAFCAKPLRGLLEFDKSVGVVKLSALVLVADESLTGGSIGVIGRLGGARLG